MFRPLVVHNFLHAQQVDRFRTVLHNVPFVDGTLTAGPLARGVKQNKQADSGAVGPLADEVIKTMFRNREVGRFAYPHRATRPLFNRYDEGDHYGHHEDNPLQSGLRADVSFTVFLSAPSEYDGGELVIEQTPYREPAGSIVLYSAGTPHRVEPVQRGTRFAAVGWIQSVVRDSSQRMLLRTFSGALDSVRSRLNEDGDDLHDLNRVRNQLMRMWAEV